MKKLLLFATLFCFSCGLLIAPVNAQSHDERHPDDDDKDKKNSKTLRMAKQTEQAIKREQSKNNRKFQVSYRQILFFKEKTLNLKLTRVHRDKFHQLNDSTAFICADFRDEHGLTYDVDIFMYKNDDNKYTRIKNRMVHKVDGIPMFAWYNDAGDWKRCQIHKPRFIDQMRKGKIDTTTRSASSYKEMKPQKFGKIAKELIQKEQANNKGYFLVPYEDSNNPLKLKLDKVHNDKYHQIDSTTAFVCANFKDDKGNTYDIDIFMKRPAPDKPYNSTSQRLVHKMNGHHLFTWYQDRGVWKRCQIRETDFITQHRIDS